MNPDDISEIILTTLRDTGKPLGTGTLRKETEFDQNKPILDRLRRLKENGLVEVSHTEELPGAASDRQYWQITAKGRKWVDENRDELTQTTARQVETTLQRTLERVDDLDDDVTEIRGKLDNWQNTSNRRSKRLSRLDTKVDDETKRAIEAGDEAWNKADEISDEMDELRDDLDEIHNRLDDLNEKIEDEQKARENAIERLGDWTKEEFGKVRKTAQRAREDARKARQRGLLDMIFKKE